MTKSYKLSATQVNFMLIVGGLLFVFGLYFISQTQSPLLLVMGGFIIAISFVHRARNVLTFKDDRFSYAPTLFGVKEMLFADVDSVSTQRGKIVVSGAGKVKELKIGVNVFSQQDRVEVNERLNALKAKS